MIQNIYSDDRRNIIYLNSQDLNKEENNNNYNENIIEGVTPLTYSDLIKDFSHNLIIDKKNNQLEIDDINYEDLYLINISEKKNDSTSNSVAKMKSSHNIFLTKKRKNKKSKRKKGHSKFEKDNVMRKLNIHFISFIVKYVNHNIQRLISKKHPLFTNLCYDFKKKINNNFFNELKNKTLGEILKNEGSNKNKRNIIYQKDENEKIFNSVYKTSLKDLLDINYTEFFRHVYKSKAHENQKFLDIYKKYKAPKNILFFDDFINKEMKKDKINGELYKERLKYISNREFISEGYPFFETKKICKYEREKLLK